MNKCLLIFVLTLCAITTQAQSISVRLITNDGAIQATNTVSLGADRVSGLLSLWAANTITRTNAGLSALTFNAFIFQELSDKGAEWTLQAGKDAIKAAGVTNSIPIRAAQQWFTLSAAQQTNVVNFLNSPASQ